MSAANCDVWLLTEMRPRVSLEGYHQHLAGVVKEGEKHWAGLLSRLPIEHEPDPHPTSALARIEGRLFCSSVLPWPLLSEERATAELWDGEDHVGRVTSTVDALAAAFSGEPVVWGGDWNQPLTGNIVGFSRGAQEVILDAVGQLSLQVPTQSLRAHNGMQNSIDHVAVPAAWIVAGVGSIKVADQLSDHDVYWVDASPVL